MEDSASHIEHGAFGPFVVSAADKFIERMREVAHTRPDDAVLLATRALRHDPNCIEAHIFLSKKAKTPELRLNHLQAAVDGGDKVWRQTAEEYGEDMSWWSYPGTRPYMQAIHALGEAHAELGNPEAAKWCFERLLRMNPHDNQGVRFSLEELEEENAPSM